MGSPETLDTEEGEEEARNIAKTKSGKTMSLTTKTTTDLMVRCTTVLRLHTRVSFLTGEMITLTSTKTQMAATLTT